MRLTNAPSVALFRRHRCPHEGSSPNRIINKSNQGRCQVKSEYQERYIPEQRKRGPFQRPADLLQNEGDIGKDTTQKVDYVPYVVRPPKPRELERYMPNPNRFEAVSEQKDHYRGVLSEAAKIPAYLRGETMRVPSARVEYKSLSHSDYQGWIPQVQRVMRSHTYMPPAERFNETSIHRRDYQRFNQPPRPTARRPDKIKYEGPVSSTTHYRTDFISKEIPARQERKREERVPPEEPFNSSSVFKEDFKDHRGAPKAPIFNPVSDLFKSSEPMQGETTKKEEFKSWDVSPRKQKEPKEYKRPDGLMDCQTTHMDYCHFGKQALPARTARPRTKLRFGREDTLDDKTNYGLSFKWFAEPVFHSKGPGIYNEIFPPIAEKSSQTSEFLDKYKRFNVVPPKMFRDRSSLFKTSEGVSKETVYGDNYHWPHVSCPSDALIKGNTSFVFDHESESGHKLFSVSESNRNVDIAVA